MIIIHLKAWNVGENIPKFCSKWMDHRITSFLCFYKDNNNILLKVVNYSQTENLYILSVNQPIRELAS